MNRILSAALVLMTAIDLVQGLAFALGLDHGEGVFAQGMRFYANGGDPLFVSGKFEVRLMLILHAVLAAPWQVYLAIALHRRSRFALPAATFYAGLMCFGMTTYLLWEFFGSVPATNRLWVLACNFTYIIMPVILVRIFWTRASADFAPQS